MPSSYITGISSKIRGTTFWISVLGIHIYVYIYMYVYIFWGPVLRETVNKTYKTLNPGYRKGLGFRGALSPTGMRLYEPWPPMERPSITVYDASAALV